MSEAQQFYQAIGELFATLAIADDGTQFLETQEARYRAFVPPKIKQKYLEQYQGQQAYWRVYPQFKEQELVFQVASLVAQPKAGHGQFVLKGDWLESEQLQIWRNAAPGKINKYNWQPRLLPVSWENAPAPDAAFWQLQAELVDGVLKVVTAQGPFPHPPRLEKLPESQWRPQRSPIPSPREGGGLFGESLKPLDLFVGDEPSPLSCWKRRSQPASSQPQPKTDLAITTVSFDWEELTPVSGKLELTIKFNTLPQVKQVDGRCHFKVDCDGRVFQVTVKQKQWSKLETASSAYAQWVAALSGKLGAATSDGFMLEEPNIQVFERSAKQNEPQTEAATPQQSQVKNQLGAKAEVESSQVEANSLEKPNPLAKPSAAKAEAKPKKIGKFNVEVR